MTGFSLEGRTALVTGASSGIGAHLATTLAEAGASVVLGARRIERTEELAERLRKMGGRALSVSLDVTDEPSVIAAYDAAEAAFGCVDTIIANAGTSAAGRSTDVVAGDAATVIDTNLHGVYLTVREGARRLIAAGSREKEHGRAVIIGSITADLTNQSDAAYAASKAGVRHLARQFAREWVRLGINVNVVQPGYICTELAGDWFDSEDGKDHIRSFHRQRLLEIDSLDDIVLFLASDASRHVTGSTITIDDGQSL